MCGPETPKGWAPLYVDRKCGMVCKAASGLEQSRESSVEYVRRKGRDQVL